MRQTVTPYLLYEDAGAALGWLADAFGFRETDRMEGEDGSVGHAEMDVGDGSTVFLGSPSGGYKNPSHLGTRTALVYAYVEDVNAHHARAKAAGAEIVEEPADQPYGDRRYAAADLEGHHWYFAQRLNG
jgi:uncharacterized glyoxalase superfamily protein PhnB